jgi:hypothetical protein
VHCKTTGRFSELFNTENSFKVTIILVIFKTNFELCENTVGFIQCDSYGNKTNVVQEIFPLK